MIVTCHACGARNRVPPSRAHQVARCGSCKQAVAPLTRPVDLSDEAVFREVLQQSSMPVLVDYWAAWCGPCRALAPELEKLARAHAGRLLVAKVDTERASALAASAGIRSLPTLALYRSGTEAKRVSGAMSAAALERAFEL